MALTFRAYSVADGAGGTSAVVTKPTGTADGDILFALYSTSNTGDAPTTVPNGWNLVCTASGFGGYRLYYKIASSEPASYTWQWTTNSNHRVTVASYYGDFNNISDTIAVISNTEYKTSNTTIRAASMTTPNANMPLLFFGSLLKTSSTTYTKPSSPTSDWVEDIDAGSTNSDIWHTFCHMVWTSSGSTGNMDATSSQTPDDKHAFAVALRTTYDRTATQTDTVSLTETQNYGFAVTQNDTILVSEVDKNSKSRLWNKKSKPTTTWVKKNK